MKIVVNQRAILDRTEKIVEDVFVDAQKSAEKGVATFLTDVKGCLDGVDISALELRIIRESEGTLRFRKPLNSYDSYIHLEIVELKS